MAVGSGLARLDGYPFEVRHSAGSVVRARLAADLVADAYGYLDGLLPGVAPDVAVIVAGEADWQSRQPYGLPFFNDDAGQIRPGILVLPAGRGDFWVGMGQDLRAASPQDWPVLLATYPDGAGGLDLQPFFDLVAVHELGHAFEVLGGLRLPTFWLGEIFANLVLHAFVASRRPDRLPVLETLSVAGAGSAGLEAMMRDGGYTTLEELEAHYTGGDRPMGPRNYVWYQYRWQRIAAAMWAADGEDGLVRFWACFCGIDRAGGGGVTAASLVPLLRAEISGALADGIEGW